MTREAEERAARQKAEWVSAIDALAEDCAKSFPHSITQAVDAMADRIRSDPRLSEAALELMLKQACRDWIRSNERKRNAQIWHPEPDRTMRGSRLRKAGQTRYTERMMDYRLTSGIRLGDAKRPELLEDANFHLTQGQTMIKKGHWFQLIADRLPNDEAAVADVHTEQGLRHLQDAAMSAK